MGGGTSAGTGSGDRCCVGVCMRGCGCACVCVRACVCVCVSMCDLTVVCAYGGVLASVTN